MISENSPMTVAKSKHLQKWIFKRCYLVRNIVSAQIKLRNNWLYFENLTKMGDLQYWPNVTIVRQCIGLRDCQMICWTGLYFHVEVRNLNPVENNFTSVSPSVHLIHICWSLVLPSLLSHRCWPFSVIAFWIPRQPFSATICCHFGKLSSNHFES